MTSILVVCTGNVCRSPIAEGFLRAAFEARMGSDAPQVASAGTMGWTGSGADPNSVEAAAERGIDISGHRARILDRADIAEATLILAMANEHVDAVNLAAPAARSRTFTLKELVRLLEAAPGMPQEDRDPIAVRVEEADELRRLGFSGNPHDEDIADPLGMPVRAFRVMADELEEWCARLADRLVGSIDVRDASESGGSSA
jgi:protein-tyrosine phosphatase